MTVSEFPPNDSCSTRVSFELRKGTNVGLPLFPAEASATMTAPGKKPCSAVSGVKGNELKLQWLLRCLSKPRQGYLQTRANCRSGSRYLPELLIARA